VGTFENSAFAESVFARWLWKEKFQEWLRQVGKKEKK